MTFVNFAKICKINVSYFRHATREYNIHKTLRHPRVVQLFDVRYRMHICIHHYVLFAPQLSGVWDRFKLILYRAGLLRRFLLLYYFSRL